MSQILNPSPARHAEWQVRSVVSMTAHAVVGGTAQLFEFRRKGQKVSYPFVFVGYGLGIGPQLGAGSAGFAPPHEFLWQTAKLVGQSFYEAGRQIFGGKPKHIPNPEFATKMAEFNDIESEGPFSAIDLHRAMGRITIASASLALGYSACYITAFKLDRTFFSSQSTAGEGAFNRGTVSGTTGVSLGASTNAGIWLRYTG